MKLANTLGIAMFGRFPRYRIRPAVVYFIQSRLIVSGWVVWNGGFDYRSRKQREMTHPTREHIDKVLRDYHEKYNQGSQDS